MISHFCVLVSFRYFHVSAIYFPVYSLDFHIIPGGFYRLPGGKLTLRIHPGIVLKNWHFFGDFSTTHWDTETGCVISWWTLHIFEYFKSEGPFVFFLENVFVTFIDKTDKRYPEKRENYWIQTLSTIVSWGLDILNSVWATLFGLGWFLGKMMHQIKGIAALFKIVWKNFSFRLSSRINLRSKILRLLRRSHEISIFYERKPSFSATQWFIYFSSSRTQTRVIAQTLRIYCNLSTIRFFM